MKNYMFLRADPVACVEERLKSLGLSTYLTMKHRIDEYLPYKLAWVSRNEEMQESYLIDFLAPLRLLKNLNKETYHELVHEYESVTESDFPYDLLFKNKKIVDLY
jgi:hypothetical protein